MIELIENEAFKQSALDLGITIPHPQTRLSPDIGTYNQQMYLHLLCMEAYTYDHSQRDKYFYEFGGPYGSDGLPIPDPETGVYPTTSQVEILRAGYEEYNIFWQRYNSALLSYIKHSPIPNSKLRDFTISFYCYMAIHIARQEGPAHLMTSSNAKIIFNLDGHVNTILNYPIDYYDDVVSRDPYAQVLPIRTGIETADRLTADTARVNCVDSPNIWESDAAIIDSYISQYESIVANAGFKAIFMYPEPPKGELTPTSAWDKIFDELEWKWYVEASGSSFNIPTRPIPPGGE